MIRKHQFYNRDFFTPKWDVKYLFIGTFNPQGGKEVPYFYGRIKNKFWKKVGVIFNDDFNPNDGDFFQKLKKYKIACMDFIEEIEYQELLDKDIVGNGYKDSKLFLKSVKKTYSKDKIIRTIKENNLTKVFFTRKPSGFRKQQKKIMDEISTYAEVIYLSSPSPMAKIQGNSNDSNYDQITN